MSRRRFACEVAGIGLFGFLGLVQGCATITGSDKGTGYDYPTVLHVRMGRMNVVDMRQEQGVQGEQPSQQR